MEQLYISKLVNFRNNGNILWLSRHPMTGIYAVTFHPEINWDMRAISLNSTITMENVVENPNLNWDWFYLTHNPNFNIETYLLFPNRPWDFQRIAMMRNVTVQILFDNTQCREFTGIDNVEDLNVENMDLRGFLM